MMEIPEGYKGFREQYRCTGRTYRMLLKALQLMSEGEDVIVSAPSLIIVVTYCSTQEK